MSELEPIRVIVADDSTILREGLVRVLAELDLTPILAFSPRLRDRAVAHLAADPEELMEYLFRQGKYNAENAPRPDIILLDLNMPRKTGMEALKEIKGNEKLRKIPVVVLTTSEADEDIIKSYELGVNSFITKPVTFDGLVKVMKNLKGDWFEIVKLPREEED